MRVFNKAVLVLLLSIMVFVTSCANDIENKTETEDKKIIVPVFLNTANVISAARSVSNTADNIEMMYSICVPRVISFEQVSMSSFDNMYKTQTIFGREVTLEYKEVETGYLYTAKDENNEIYITLDYNVKDNSFDYEQIIAVDDLAFDKGVMYHYIITKGKDIKLDETGYNGLVEGKFCMGEVGTDSNGIKKDSIDFFTASNCFYYIHIDDNVAGVFQYRAGMLNLKEKGYSINIDDYAISEDNTNLINSISDKIEFKEGNSAYCLYAYNIKNRMYDGIVLTGNNFTEYQAKAHELSTNWELKEPVTL